MPALNFELGAYAYKSKPMNAFDQFKLVRKIGPIVAAGLLDFIPLIKDLSKFGIAEMAAAEARVEGAAQAEDDTAKLAAMKGRLPLDRLAQVALPVMRELAKLPDDDFKDVIGTCLSLCSRCVAPAPSSPVWVEVWNAQLQGPMSDDLRYDAMAVSNIAFHVMSGNLQGFFIEGRSLLLALVALA